MFKMIKSIATVGTGLVAKVHKYSPEIKLVLGLVAGGAAIGTAIKASFDTADILNQNEEEKDVKVEIMKKYIPTAGLTLMSGGLIISSFTEMKARYLGAVALYNGLSGFFQTYRQRVRDRYGNDAEKEIYLGEYTRKEVDEKGKVISETKTLQVDGMSPYSVIFTEYLPNGEKNKEWDQNRTFNLNFLKAQESIANDLLQRRKYVFLNEVLDSLGFPMTTAGGHVGWILGNGDNVIDFNLYINERDAAKNFLKENNYPDQSYILDFNVDGIILDKIDKIGG